MTDTVRIRTFWISIAMAVLIPGFVNWAQNERFQERVDLHIEVMTKQLTAQSERTLTLENRLTEEMLTRTDERFRRTDWEREESEINEKFARLIDEDNKLHREINRAIEKIDEMWQWAATAFNTNGAH